MQKILSEPLLFLIYHFYEHKCSIYVNNMRYIDSNNFFHKTHFEVSSTPSAPKYPSRSTIFQKPPRTNTDKPHRPAPPPDHPTPHSSPLCVARSALAPPPPRPALVRRRLAPPTAPHVASRMVICPFLVSLVSMLARSHRRPRSEFLLDLLFGGEDAAACACNLRQQSPAAPVPFSPQARATWSSLTPRACCHRERCALVVQGLHRVASRQEARSF
jgi:hypothetical protein